LIDLLSVIAVMAILMSIVIGAASNVKKRANISRARSELAALALALEAYKRHYGDYPETGTASQASVAITSRIGVTQAQALLFNALTGVYGPTNFSARLNGPLFVELSKFTLEVPLTDTTQQNLGTPTGSPPAKQAIANCFVDPWGNRYLYYYKRSRADTLWRAPAYILYSAGPDGKLGTSTTGNGALDNGLNPTTGLYSGSTQTLGFNADNIYANQ